MPTSPSPKIPYGGFSPVRLKDRNIRRDLPRGRVCHHPSCLLTSIGISRLRVRDDGAGRHLRASGFPLYPKGPPLRSGLCYPGPSSLNRLHPSHSPAHPDFAAARSIRDIFALTTVHLRYRLLFCLPSLSEQTRLASSHREGVYFRAFGGLVARPAAGYHYSAHLAICTGGTPTR
jgi:hypothetical protein